MGRAAIFPRSRLAIIVTYPLWVIGNCRGPISGKSRSHTISGL